MNDLKDFEFDSKNKDDEEGQGYETGRFEDERFETGHLDDGGKGPNRWWLVGLILVAVVAGLIYWSTRSKPAVEAEAPPAAPAEQAAAPGPRAEPREPLELPTLNASDEIVAQLVQTLSSNPRLASLLATDDLVRRFTVSIANISEGLSPRSHLDDLEPAEPFSVRRVGDSLVPSAKSYERYDSLANVVASLDTAGTVALYRQLEPLIDEAYAELGYPGQDFDDVLLAALDHLIATPVVDADVELVEMVTVYSFADPELEELSSAQKQLLRTGPANARKIVETLRSLRSELLQSN